MTALRVDQPCLPTVSTERPRDPGATGRGQTGHPLTSGRPPLGPQGHSWSRLLPGEKAQKLLRKVSASTSPKGWLMIAETVQHPSTPGQAPGEGLTGKESVSTRRGISGGGLWVWPFFSRCLKPFMFSRMNLFIKGPNLCEK